MCVNSPEVRIGWGDFLDFLKRWGLLVGTERTIEARHLANFFFFFYIALLKNPTSLHW